MNNSKQTILVPKPFGNRTKPHRRLTQLCGTLVPIFSKELIPNTELSQKIMLGVSLPPLVSDTFMNVQYKVEAFFCPLRLCFAGFENWWTSKKSNMLDDPSDIDDFSSFYAQVFDFIPYANVPLNGEAQSDSCLQVNPVFAESVAQNRGLRPIFGKGTLLNYLGLKYAFDDVDPDAPSQGGFPLNLGKLVAYHLIWQHWYRAPLVQNECFAVPSRGTYDVANFTAGVIPFLHCNAQSAIVASNSNENRWKLADGCSLFQLRQRNYGFDYFTLGFPSDSQPSMSVQVSNGSFSIASLRASNSLQQWKELYQIAGNRMVDKCKTYGANLSDGVAQRPIFLGSATYDVYTSGVQVTATNNGGNSNPFSYEAGGRVGNAFGSGSDFIIDHFTAHEPGYIMVIGSLVPKATYGSGIPRDLTRYTRAGFSQDDLADYPSYMLQNTGNEPIRAYELCFANADNLDTIFGYSDKYADWFYDYSDAVGEFGANGSLSAFVLQRKFAKNPAINSAFLEISPYDMDDITIISAAVSSFGCQVDIDFDNYYKWPLYPHSMPSLQNPAYEHGVPVSLHRGGFRF